MPKIVFHCHVCNKQTSVKNETSFGNQVVEIFECGHFRYKLDIQETKEDELSFTSDDGYKPHEFQLDGMRFAERANLFCVIADECGLGKTIQALGIIKHHPEFQPTLVVCKSSLMIQWQRETLRWVNLLSQTIDFSDSSCVLEGFPIYLVSFDRLRRMDISKLPSFKMLVIDECQYIKNNQSRRTHYIREIIRKDSPKVIALSGDPIKNNFLEFFPILNILHPEKFGVLQQFKYNWTDYWSKKPRLIHVERFHEFTKDFILRRRKIDVLKDLPELTRDYRWTEFDDNYKAAYEKLVDQYLDYLDSNSDPWSFNSYATTLDYIARIRHLTGIAKIQAAVDYIEEFLLMTDRKLAVFIHHKQVSKLLEVKLGAGRAVILESGLSPEEKQKRIDKFKYGNERICILSTLAFGEGLNLQFCSDCLFVERQWNPANESQAEGRLHRDGQKNSVISTYLLAVNTVDEFLHKLVRKKSVEMGEVLDNIKGEYSEQAVLKEITEALRRSREIQ